MAQQFPVTAKVIYDVLSADTTFTNLLGTYEFKGGGGTLTALSVISAGESLPSLRNVTGVECVIQDAGDTQQVNHLTDEGYLVTTWSVFLIAWEPSKGSDLQAATNRILRRFNGAQAVQTVASSDGLGSLVQNKILIRSINPVIPL